MGSVTFSGYPYSLGTRCGSEFIATALAIYIGECSVCNMLLQKTKGNGFGWGWLSFGFGFPFGLVGFMFGHISSNCNPAFVMAQYVMGTYTGKEFALLSLSDFAGAIVGAVLMWLTYLPHFNIVPEPPRGLILGDGSDEDRQRALDGTLTSRPRTLRTPSLLIPKASDLLTTAGRGYGNGVLNVASYEDEKDYREARAAGVPGALHNLRRHLELTAERNREHAEAVEEALSRGASKEKVERVLSGMKEDLQTHEAATMAHLRALSDQAAADGPGTPGADGDAGDAITKDTAPVTLPKSANAIGGFLDDSAPAEDGGGAGGRGAAGTVGRFSNWIAGSLGTRKEGKSIDDDGSTGSGPATGRRGSAIDLEAEKELARYRAQVELDANIKLGIFSTRPAIYSPFFNFLCEFLCTVTLIFCVLLMSIRASTLYQPARQEYSAMISGWVGITIIVFIINLGGPTGLAVNPARDLGPRIAHFFLPIPGKGTSEFLSYGWVPFFAPFAGGAAAGGFVLAYNHMNRSNVPNVAA